MRINFENDVWVELRVVTFGDTRAMSKHSEDQLDQVAFLLSRIITAWSYDRPVDEAGIDALPLSVFSVLSEHIQKASTGTKEDTLPLDSGSTLSSSASTNSVKEPATPVPTT